MMLVPDWQNRINSSSMWTKEEGAKWLLQVDYV